MKPIIHIAANAPLSIRQTDRKQHKNSQLSDAGKVINGKSKLSAELLAKIYHKPAKEEMLLKNQGGLTKRNPSWELVEKTVRELDPGYLNSYACLSTLENSYIQCLHGFNGYHLEWRITHFPGSYTHYRACYPKGSKKSFELKKHDFVSDGQHRDLLNLEDVIDAFQSFHNRQGLPICLKWRVLDL